jgi:hypothetical protein
MSAPKSGGPLLAIRRPVPAWNPGQVPPINELQPTAKPTRLLVVLYHALTLLASSFSYTSPPSTKSPKMNNLFHHPSLSNVLAKATFPPDNQLAHVVNGERNKLLLSLANTGKENYTLLNAAASYHDPARQWALVSSLSRLIPGASCRIACC